MDDQNPSKDDDDDDDDDDDTTRGIGGERAERKRRHVSALEKREIREALERKIKNVLAKPAVNGRKTTRACWKTTGRKWIKC